MSEHPPTLLIVYLRPEHDEGARYHIDEALTTAGITYRLIAVHEERVSLESAAPFVITHIEKRMVFAFDHARPGNKKQIPGADADIVELKGCTHVLTTEGTEDTEDTEEQTVTAPLCTLRESA